MPKKVVRSVKNKTKSPVSKIPSDGIEKILVENFVSLQKVMVKLSSNFDNLAKQMSKLLELFEVSAKTLAEKELDLNQTGNKKIIEKIDNLLEQNKIIARGLTLVHERIPQEQNPQMMPAQQPQKFPQERMMSNNSQKPQGTEEYQKSISSNTPPRAPMNIPPKK